MRNLIHLKWKLFLWIMSMFLFSTSASSQNSNVEVSTWNDIIHPKPFVFLIEMHLHNIIVNNVYEEYSVEVNRDYELLFFNSAALTWKNAFSYASGELPPELVWKKYFGETVEVNFQSTIQYQLTDNLTIGLLSNWGREIGVNQTQLFSSDKNRQMQLNASYSASKWAVEIKTQHLRTSNGMDALTDINNQPLGEVKESGLAIFHPEDPWSFVGTVTYSF